MQVYAQEGEQGQQWGIKLAIVVEFTLSAQCKPEQDAKHSTSLDLTVSSTHTLFLPKDEYAKAPCEGRIAYTQEQRLKLNEAKDVNSDPDNRALDSNASSKLPELLSVFVWGGHERLESIPVSSTDDKPHLGFKPMAHFSTVRVCCQRLHGR